MLDPEESGREKEMSLFRVVVVRLEEVVERGDPVGPFGFKVPLDTLGGYRWLVVWDPMALQRWKRMKKGRS